MDPDEVNKGKKLLHEFAQHPQAQEFMQNNGNLANIVNFLQDELRAIKNTPINVAICGLAGQGKSTLINTFCGMVPDDEGAADVDIIDCTVMVRRYPHPDCPNIVFYDLPGVGTPNYPQCDYEALTNLQSFDFFLLVTATRFYDCDLWLVQRLTQLNKPFFFLRTKIDMDITNWSEDHPRDPDPRSTIEKKIREDIKFYADKIPECKFDQSKLYIICGKLRSVDFYDFPRLKHDILDILPQSKKNALAVHLIGYTDELIEAKYVSLKARIPLIAAISFICALPPIPGLSFGVDMTFLLAETKGFAKVFGLSQDKIIASFGIAAVSDSILTVLKEISAVSETEGVKKFLLSYSGSTISEEVLRVVPIVGSFIGGALSFATTYFALNSILSKLKDAAKKISLELINSRVAYGSFN